MSSIRPLWSTEAIDALIALASSAQAEGFASYESATVEITNLQAGSTTNAAGAAAFDRAADMLFAHLAQSFAQGATDPTRHALGAIDDTLVVKILSKEPSFADLSDAAIWARGDGDAVARDQSELSATALAIAEMLARDDDSEPVDEA